jgi:hypothetical protein
VVNDTENSVCLERGGKHVKVVMVDPDLGRLPTYS